MRRAPAQKRKIEPDPVFRNVLVSQVINKVLWKGKKDVARTIVRRAERDVWKVCESEAVAPEVPRYLNRLSDLLFVIARVLVRHERGAEVMWNRQPKEA